MYLNCFVLTLERRIMLFGITFSTAVKGTTLWAQNPRVTCTVELSSPKSMCALCIIHGSAGVSLECLQDLETVSSNIQHLFHCLLPLMLIPSHRI